MPTVYLKNGTEVEAGGPEDQATWLTCGICEQKLPCVGLDEDDHPRCRGTCGGTRPNPNLPTETQPDTPLSEKVLRMPLRFPRSPLDPSPAPPPAAA